MPADSLQRNGVVVHRERVLEDHCCSRRAGALPVTRIVEQHDVRVPRQRFERLAAFDGAVEGIPAAEDDDGLALRMMRVRDADEPVTAMDHKILHGVPLGKHGAAWARGRRPSDSRDRHPP